MSTHATQSVLIYSLGAWWLFATNWIVAQNKLIIISILFKMPSYTNVLILKKLRPFQASWCVQFCFSNRQTKLTFVFILLVWMRITIANFPKNAKKVGVKMFFFIFHHNHKLDDVHWVKKERKKSKGDSIWNFDIYMFWV